MATRCVACMVLGYVLFVSQPISETIASPISIGKFNVSKAVDSVRKFPGKVLSGAKTLLGLAPGTTTISPPTTTKSPLYVVLIPKGFSKKVHNVSENETSTRVVNPANSTKSGGFIAGTKSIWNKAKSYWSKTTTLPPPSNVWLVPVDFSKLRGTPPPCSKEKSLSGQGCLSSSQLAGFSWWTLSLSLTGALLMGVGAWIVFRRRLPGTFTAPDSVKVRPPKLSWPWYPSEPECTMPRGPVPLPPPEGKMTMEPPVKSTLGPPPSWPAPPVPASDRANSLYQTTLAAAHHVYATPTPPRYSASPSNASEHVHVYEIPPCFPSYDLADQEIDTTTIKKAACRPKQAMC